MPPGERGKPATVPMDLLQDAVGTSADEASGTIAMITHLVQSVLLNLRVLPLATPFAEGLDLACGRWDACAWGRRWCWGGPPAALTLRRG